jgi:hypothetical protein
MLRKSLRTFFRLLWHPLCRHTETLTKTAGTRVYTECLRCEYQSNGVVIAGHDYASTKHSWEPAPSAANVLRGQRNVSLALEHKDEPRTHAMPPVAISQEPTSLFALRDQVLAKKEDIDASLDKTGEYALTYGDMEFLVSKPLPPVAIASEPATPVLGNLAGHATSARRKSPLCTGCGKPKESTRPNSNKCRACDRGRPRKISAIKPRKTSRKPSSKRSKTA